MRSTSRRCGVRSRVGLALAALAAAGAASGGEPVGILSDFSGAEPAAERNLAVTSPRPGSTVRGRLTLRARVNVPGAASVQYLLNGRSMHDFSERGELVPVVAKAPYRYDWPTACAWDGAAAVQVAALDRRGAVLAVSAPVSVTIANGGVGVRMTSPDPGRTLSGTVRWSVTTTERDVDGIQMLVDGARYDIKYSNRTASVDLDTTRFGNGVHELFAAVHAGKSKGSRPVAMAQALVRFDNGKTPLGLRPRFRDVFLATGEEVALEPRLVYTDGTSEPVKTGVDYASADRSVASVDAAGRVAGQGPGVTVVTIRADGRSAETRVVVTLARHFPHFAKDGAILTDYDPKRSLFVRQIFTLEPRYLEQEPRMARALKDAAVNALETGMFLLPQDCGNPQDFAGYRKVSGPRWDRTLSVLEKHDFSMILTGDNVARWPKMLHHSTTTSWAPAALQYDFTRARDSGRVIAVEMIDESSGMWGPTPFPTDGRWKKHDPPIPDDAFATLMRTIRRVPNHPPVSWPILWLSGKEAGANWMGDPFMADYTSLYWDVHEWRRAYPRGPSLPQVRGGLDNVTVGFLPGMQIEKPSLLCVSICGPYYDKLGQGANYVPGQDRLKDGGNFAELQAAQVMYAAAMGLSGVRCYNYDSEHWKNERRNGPVGAGDRQTGTDPFTTGPGRWRALSAAFNLVKDLEPFLLQPRTHALDLGPDIVTGARAGAQGQVLIAVNFAEFSREVRVDLTPYRGEARRAVRHRLLGAERTEERLGGAVDTDRLALRAGEAVLWVFPGDRRQGLRREF